MQETPRSSRLLHSAVDRIPVGRAVLAGELRSLHVNAALAALNELRGGAHIGRRVRDVVPAHIADRLEPVLLEVLATGSPQAGVVLRGGSSAEPRSWEGSVFPVGGNGHAAGVGVLVLETTERDRAVARARYLARGGRALGAPLALEAPRHGVAGRGVPGAAGGAFVELVRAGGGTKRAAGAPPAPRAADIARDYDRRYPLNPSD